MTTPVTHIARWDLDKTYLRTEFDTFRDLVKTAFERADEKRTNPGAATLLREMVRSGVAVHILSGSPEQMRRRLEDKLRLDGITWESFTLKPNLENLLRLRFRAVKDQLGYKLPALLRSRAAGARSAGAPPHETLFGDDAEADAFVYSLYADVVSGHVTPEQLLEVCERGRVYPDVMQTLAEDARTIDRFEAVERILIHLEGQTPPENFRVYGVASSLSTITCKLHSSCTKTDDCPPTPCCAWVSSSSCNIASMATRSRAAISMSHVAGI